MSKLETPCFYREGDVSCRGGYLTTTQKLPDEQHGKYVVHTTLRGPVMVGDTVIACPRCKEGVIITPEGQEILDFMKKHLSSMVQEIMDEYAA